jgi:DNA-binding transcriptional LysR family regulator
MIDLNDIRLLMQVIEHGSYSAASRAVGVPKSTISQRIAALEKTVGTGLLRRTSRSFSLTDAGAMLLPYARAMDDLARRIENELLDQGPEITGILRVSCSIVIGQFAMAHLVPKFLDHHPKASVRVESSNRLIDLVAEGFDMAVRGHVGQLRDSTLVQRVVARTPWSLAASPGWIEANGMPTTPNDLSDRHVLCFAAPQYANWTLHSCAGSVTIAVRPRLASDDMLILRSSAISGAGIVSLPRYVLASALAEGHLMSVLPEWSPTPSSISVLTPPKPQSSRLAQAFSDFLAQELPQLLRG